jgi:hypothetical protein
LFSPYCVDLLKEAAKAAKAEAKKVTQATA